MSTNISEDCAATLNLEGDGTVEAKSRGATLSIFAYEDFVSFALVLNSRGDDDYIDMTVEQALEFAAKIGEIANMVAERESSL